MIGFLSGIPQLRGADLLVLVQGVGYLVHVGPMTQARAMSEPHLNLHIHTHVREESFDLFGFLDEASYNLFKALIQVSGVGPKTALLIVDKGVDQVIGAIQTSDVSTLSSVPRVGKKLAQKIIIEMKSKVGSLRDLDLGPKSSFEADVRSALEQLGFSDSQLQHVWGQLDWQTEATPELIIKQAITLIGKKD
jgi:holliday junction DNA helicase RuvA